MEGLDAIVVDAVAQAAGVSKYYFCRRFKACTGPHFREYLVRRRIARAKELLKTTGRSITDIFPEVGFKDMTHFAESSRSWKASSPPSSAGEATSHSTRLRFRKGPFGWEGSRYLLPDARLGCLV